MSEDKEEMKHDSPMSDNEAAYSIYRFFAATTQQVFGPNLRDMLCSLSNVLQRASAMLCAQHILEIANDEGDPEIKKRNISSAYDSYTNKFRNYLTEELNIRGLWGDK